MKKSLSLLLALALCMLCASCSCAEKKGASSSQTTASHPFSDSSEYDKLLYASSDKGDVEIHVPQAQNSTAANNAMFEAVKTYFSTYNTGELNTQKPAEVGTSQYQLICSHRVTLDNDEFFSAEFAGTSDLKDDSHPPKFAFGIILNSKNGAKLDMRDFYYIEDDFIKSLSSNKSAWITGADKDSKLSYLSEKMLNGLVRSGNISFYRLPKKMGVILNGLPNNLGNYCVFEIPLDEMNKFKKAA